MNKVLLTGRLTRDPELRSLASGSSVAQFVVATNEFRGNGKERAEYHNVVVWDRLAWPNDGVKSGPLCYCPWQGIHPRFKK